MGALCGDDARPRVPSDDSAERAEYVDRAELRPLGGFLPNQDARRVQNVCAHRLRGQVAITRKDRGVDLVVILEALQAAAGGRHRADPGVQHHVPLLLQHLHRSRVPGDFENRGVKVPVRLQGALRAVARGRALERVVDGGECRRAVRPSLQRRLPGHRHLDHQAQLEAVEQRVDRGLQHADTAVG